MEMKMTIELNKGLSKEEKTQVAGVLSKVMADAYALYLKTHGYHWNVRGPNFPALHPLFEGQYQEQWAALDDIAERIRALGELAPQGYATFGNLSAIRDGDPNKESDAMIEDLLQDNQTILATIRNASQVAETAGDEATVDLLNARTAAHEKHSWMLRATLGAK
jgi:starvation-inducible DNA-binding protein